MATTRIQLVQKRFAVAGLLALASSCVLPGCYSEGGLGWSEDQYVYVSRPYQPWVITLKDTRTGQDFWTVEVPVGKQLVIHFQKDQGTKDSYTPDLMEWGFMAPGEESGRLGNSMPVPPSNSRRLDPVIRPVPELPPRMANAITPSGGGTSSSSSNP